MSNGTPHPITIEALAAIVLMEDAAKQLPHGWGSWHWDDALSRLAILIVETAPKIDDDQRNTLLAIGALIAGQIVKEQEAKGLLGRFLGETPDFSGGARG